MAADGSKIRSIRREAKMETMHVARTNTVTAARHYNKIWSFTFLGWDARVSIGSDLTEPFHGEHKCPHVYVCAVIRIPPSDVCSFQVFLFVSFVFIYLHSIAVKLLELGCIFLFLIRLWPHMTRPNGQRLTTKLRRTWDARLSLCECALFACRSINAWLHTIYISIRSMCEWCDVRVRFAYGRVRHVFNSDFAVACVCSLRRVSSALCTKTNSRHSSHTFWFAVCMCVRLSVCGESMSATGSVWWCSAAASAFFRSCISRLCTHRHENI